MAHKRHPRPPGLADVREKLWAALRQAHDVLAQAVDGAPDLRLDAVSAVSAVSEIAGQLHVMEVDAAEKITLPIEA
jgi:hypothetical protein